MAPALKPPKKANQDEEGMLRPFAQESFALPKKLYPPPYVPSPKLQAVQMGS